MTDLTITRTRPPTSPRRARVLSEAVVSAYLRDISPPRRPRAAAAVPLASGTAEPPVLAPAPLPASAAPVSGGVARRVRPRGRTRAARRRSPLAVGTAPAGQALRRP